jgi:dCMP deaminase
VTKHEAFLGVAQAVSKMSTCLRRQVGCVLTDDRGRVVGTGYNGAPSGLAHCADRGGCARKDCDPGESLHLCRAIHAEANALMHCMDIKRVAACYVFGGSPCTECAKLLCNSGATDVFVDRLYALDQVKVVARMFVEKGVALHFHLGEGKSPAFETVVDPSNPKGLART